MDRSRLNKSTTIRNGKQKMSITEFPTNPTDGQEFVTADGRVYVYSSSEDSWRFKFSHPSSFATVAFTGSYTDLLDTPSIPAPGIPDTGLDNTPYLRYNQQWVSTSQVRVPIREMKFNPLVPQVASEPGLVAWDNDTGTLNIGMGLSDDVVQQVGLETFYIVRNGTGSTLEDGTLVMASGTIGNSGRIVVTPVSNSSSLLPHRVMGIVTHDILPGDDGYVTNFGLVREIPTNGASVGETWGDGDILFAHPTQAGKLTKVEPRQPYRKIIVALVVKAHHSNGTLMVRVSHGSTLHQIHDVEINSPTAGDMLVMNGGFWENRSPSAVRESLELVKQTSATDRTPGRVALVEYVQLITQPNDIGTQGESGFGVGVCPPNILPAGIFPIIGFDQLGHANYGNYITTNGSIMVYVPKFYYRIASTSSPRNAVYGLNCIDVVPGSAYTNRAAAAAAGYALPRCFIDAGVEIPGFFIDKYLASADGVGSCKSVPNVDVLSLFNNVSHAPITQGMTGCTGILADAVVLSRARGSGFYCASIFQYSAIALLSLAHAQAATGTVNCAWYDPTGVRNFPKGCNNNALADVDDNTVTYAAGTTFAAKGKTRAITGFAKTTHNGQECGVADINGILFEAALGLTAAGTNATSTTQITNGDVYVLKESVRMSDLTSGFGGATDAWGDTTSLLTNYDLHTQFFPWGSAIDWVRFGNGANQVFSESNTGGEWLRTSTGVQRDNNSVSAGGTNLFGVDGCYRYNRMNLFPLVGGTWTGGSRAGLFARAWNDARSNSSSNVGFRSALSAFG